VIGFFLLQYWRLSIHSSNAKYASWQNTFFNCCYGLCSSANPSPMCSNELVCCQLIFSISTASESAQGTILFVPCHFGVSLLFPTPALAHSNCQMPLKGIWGTVLSSGNMFFSALTKNRRFNKRISLILSLSKTVHLDCSIELPEIVLQGDLKKWALVSWHRSAPLGICALHMGQRNAELVFSGWYSCLSS